MRTWSHHSTYKAKLPRGGHIPSSPDTLPFPTHSPLSNHLIIKHLTNVTFRLTKRNVLPRDMYGFTLRNHTYCHSTAHLFPHHKTYATNTNKTIWNKVLSKQTINLFPNGLQTEAIRIPYTLMLPLQPRPFALYTLHLTQTAQRKGESKCPAQPTNFFHGVRHCLHVSGVSKKDSFFSRSKRLSSCLVT